jgi:hypothetical protein
MQYKDSQELLNDKTNTVTEFLLKKINEEHPELHQTETGRLRPAARSVIQAHVLEFFGPDVLNQDDPNHDAVQHWLNEAATVREFAVEAVSYVFEDEINRLNARNEPFDPKTFMEDKIDYMVNAYASALHIDPNEAISLDDKMRLMNHLIERNDDYLSGFVHDAGTLKDFATQAAHFLFEDEVQYHIENNQIEREGAVEDHIQFHNPDSNRSGQEQPSL